VITTEHNSSAGLETTVQKTASITYAIYGG